MCSILLIFFPVDTSSRLRNTFSVMEKNMTFNVLHTYILFFQWTLQVGWEIHSLSWRKIWHLMCSILIFYFFSGHFKWVEKYILCYEESIEYEVEEDEQSIGSVSTLTSVMSQEFINLEYGKISKPHVNSLYPLQRSCRGVYWFHHVRPSVDKSYVVR